MIQVKLATRWDTPGCIDVVDHTILYTEDHMKLDIQCKIENRVHRYEIDLDLFGKIDPANSTYELASVGRVFIYLDKEEDPSRWKRLQKSTEKVQNLKIWWEQYEKFERELSQFERHEDDEEYEGESEGSPLWDSTEKAKKEPAKKKELP
jgi:hypothetical protein